jgi:hypothetical protein
MYNFNYITLLKNLAFFQFEKKVKYFTFTHFTSKMFFLKYFYLNFLKKEILVKHYLPNRRHRKPMTQNKYFEITIYKSEVNQ